MCLPDKEKISRDPRCPPINQETTDHQHTRVPWRGKNRPSLTFSTDPSAWPFCERSALLHQGRAGDPASSSGVPHRLICRCFAEETLHRVPATCTGPVFQFRAVIAGRHLGGQERGEVVLPEGSVNPSCLKKTLDMPCRSLHKSSVGGGVIYGIRMGQMGY